MTHTVHPYAHRLGIIRDWKSRWFATGADFGRMLDESWQLKRSLSSAISNERIDGVYEAARRAGALGGKLLGAGGGGFMLIFAPPDVLDYVAAHECAHLIEMNHSPAFWTLVERIFPDWQPRRDWLRQHGASLHALRFA